jgi:hypothetical protein
VVDAECALAESAVRDLAIRPSTRDFEDARGLLRAEATFADALTARFAAEKTAATRRRDATAAAAKAAAAKAAAAEEEANRARRERDVLKASRVRIPKERRGGDDDDDDDVEGLDGNAGADADDDDLDDAAIATRLLSIAIDAKLFDDDDARVASLVAVVRDAHFAAVKRLGDDGLGPVKPGRATETMRAFARLRARRRCAVAGAVDTYARALAALADAERKLEIASASLESLEPRLDVGLDARTSGLMRVAATARDVDAMHAEALETEEKIFIRRRHLLDRRAACDDDAAAALSAYDDAMRASAPFAKVDLEELRRYVTPPGLIRAVLEAASLLLGRGGGGGGGGGGGEAGAWDASPPDWRAARAVLADASKHPKSLTRRLRAFAKETIPRATADALRAYATRPNFTPLAALQARP